MRRDDYDTLFLQGYLNIIQRKETHVLQSV